MLQSGRFLLWVLVVNLPRAILCLKDVVLEIEPEIVHLGEDSTLRCSYDLEDAPLYCVKWYRGRHEFYRYTPKEHPSTKIFPFTGIHVDLKQSDEKQVVLREVGFSLSGKFTCEVTTDAPLFSTAAVSKDMLVVVLPNQEPTLVTEKTSYDNGDVLRANCTSPPSRPAATLTFMLNNKVVCEKCATRKHATQELWWSELSLELPLFPSHFNSDRITLKCIARIGKIYERDVQVTMPNTSMKDPIPARVTQSSAGSHYIKTFNVINILYLLLFISVS
ncbi:uncharacterized protein LOC659130 isoform X2 [Tribolium castaneum]|uniref:Ig-like domain-containing protein n=1 Tax=Tribolium castaneum TaxID=7070 RepID=D7EJ22_TRICA|nr:PREDICTED: uncharacterized protein LOC659130 [Tribolium castaneum]EFA12550.2 hypothetical protein TcasGA2_TC001958 [Tribolium castaneum]|eukprot:XP_008192816.1 PREDICTED: uncharacterized protein LOC659130 [Tribolium castaneum]